VLGLGYYEGADYDRSGLARSDRTGFTRVWSIGALQESVKSALAVHD
jgi:hypothetical protein